MNLNIKQVVQETKDAITIVFERPQGIHFLAGQFLTLISSINGNEVRRSYSLSSAPYEMDKLSVSIKRVKDGLMSNFLADNASSLGSMEILEPMGNFTFKPNATNKKHYVLFGGGSGITPMMSILKTALKEESNSFITLIYANTDEESIIFKSELDKLQTENASNFKLIHIIENPSDSWNGRYGRINADEVVRLVQSIPTNLEKVFYMCGPTGYMESVEGGLKKLDVSKKNIHKESFTGNTEVSEEALEGGDRMVTIIFDKKEYKYNVPAGTSILDAGLDEGIDLPYSCQSGVCTACRGKCKSGKVDLTEVEGLSEKELNEGYVLCCVGYPLSDDVVIEIG